VADALAALHRGRAIMTALLALAPGHPAWKRDIAWFDRAIALLQGTDKEAAPPPQQAGRP